MESTRLVNHLPQANSAVSWATEEQNAKHLICHSHYMYGNDDCEIHLIVPSIFSWL